MSKILLFEGYDGSGKTTLIKNFKDFLTTNSLSFTEIDREFSSGVSNLTSCIRDKDATLAPNAEVLLRIAREFERLEAVKTKYNKFDYIILDRCILSAISWIKYYNLDYTPFQNIVNFFLENLGNSYLIYCSVPFEISWMRINQRGQLSKKEQKGKEENILMFNALYSTFTDFESKNIQKFTVKADESPENCLTQLTTLIGLK
jgi:thymidylate kinase